MSISNWGILAALLILTGSAAQAYDYNPSDFATEVVEYLEGTGIPWDPVSFEDYNDPYASLDRPTIDTTGDGWDILIGDPIPVVAVYPAFRSFELVSIGKGGRLIVKFDHLVEDDPHNPCGIDLIVFGNAWFNQPNGSWTNGNPNNAFVGTGVISEPALVSVSQDGQTWYTFTDGPFADDFAPTLGRIYDPENPEPSLGAWNLWWSIPTDPTRPLNPSLNDSHFAGYSVAEMAMAYKTSAGGTGFDISQVGLDWIQYVKIENPADSTVVPEIDAFADVAPTAAPADFDCDTDVDQDDYTAFQSCITGPALGPPMDECQRADFDHDGDVDQSDFGLFQRCVSGSDVAAEADCMN